VLLQDGEDVLEEVELYCQCGSHLLVLAQIVAMHDKRLFLFVARFVHDHDVTLLSEWRLGRRR